MDCTNKNCPAYAKCLAPYRGSRCKATRATYGLGDPITNADRIRAMADEEMAWELARICRMPFYKDDSEIDEYEVDCWANWLKQEVET